MSPGNILLIKRRRYSNSYRFHLLPIFFLHASLPLLASSSALPNRSIEQASNSAPVLFLMFGPNGAGKTTSSAKLAHMYVITTLHFAASRALISVACTNPLVALSLLLQVRHLSRKFVPSQQTSFVSCTISPLLHFCSRHLSGCCRKAGESLLTPAVCYCRYLDGFVSTRYRSLQQVPVCPYSRLLLIACRARSYSLQFTFIYSDRERRSWQAKRPCCCKIRCSRCSCRK
jgi:hypothetical protein